MVAHLYAESCAACQIYSKNVLQVYKCVQSTKYTFYISFKRRA